MFDWIVDVVTGAGLLGVALLMFLENVFPPIPSEVIMPLAGFSAARGGMSLTGVVIAGSAGALAGAVLWYWVGVRVGLDRVNRFVERYGRWLTLTTDDVASAVAWFERHGGVAVFIGRLIPTIRTLISVPAGVSRMALLSFVTWSTLGTVIWTLFLTLMGYVLESQYDRVADWMNPVSIAVLVGTAGWYLWRVATHEGRAKG
jgi:membrane protein DedA with SNARE-associated domain